ncbi:MAG TPA: DeoR/GlpR family DNA-binding transcription regulator [Candidatus Limnocylindrales bacterium]
MDSNRVEPLIEETPGLDGTAKRPALARQRQTQILERVREEGAVRVADLVRSLGVSDMTIRRDLEVLHERGLIEKVHGGATAIEGSSLFEPGFTVKSTLMQSEKALIAGTAAGLVTPGTAIAISAGTTTFALARRLTDVPGLTVLTNSVPVADVLYRDGRPDQTVILSGGVRTPSDALVGPFAVEVIRSLHVDTVFMGSHGMDYRTGLTTPNILEAETNRALIEAGRRLIVLADHTKWGIIGISSVARLEDADTIITDSGLDQGARGQLASVVRRLMLVDVATGDVQTIEGGGSHSSHQAKPEERP